MKHLTVFFILCWLLLLVADLPTAYGEDMVNINVWATEVAPMSLSITAGGETFYSIVAISANPFARDRHWLLGLGGGVRIGDISLDGVEYKINEGAWTAELNQLYSLRLLARLDVGRACMIGGFTMNRFISTVSDGARYDTFAIGTSCDGGVHSKWWPGFVAGVQF